MFPWDMMILAVAIGLNHLQGEDIQYTPLNAFQGFVANVDTEVGKRLLFFLTVSPKDPRIGNVQNYVEEEQTPIYLALVG